MPLDLAVEIGDREAVGKFHATIGFDAPGDVVGRGIKVRPAAMAVEFKFFAMRGHGRHNRFRCCLPPFESRGGQDGAHDDGPSTCAKAATEGGA